MGFLSGAVCVVTFVAMLVVVAAAVTSWFAVQPGSAMERVALALQGAVDPVLGPLRSLLPQPRVGGLAVDASPVVVLVVLWAIRLLIGC